MLRLTPRQHEAWYTNNCFMGGFLEFQHMVIPTTADPTIVPTLFAERLWSHPGNVVDTNGNVWKGLGDMVDFSGLSWKANTYVQDITFVIGRLTQDQSSLLERSEVKGYPGRFYYGLIDENRNIIDNLILRRQFVLDTVNGRRTQDGKFEAVYTGHSGKTDYNTATNYLWSKEDQKRRIRLQNLRDSNGKYLIDLGFDDIVLLEAGIDRRWNVGEYDDHGDSSQVDHPTSISGTRLPTVENDFYDPRRSV